jgi:hypothetical protein
MPAYQGRFPIGSTIRIAGLAELRAFRAEWKFHDKLCDDQMSFAGRSARVARVGYYHGGDPLYELRGVPGVWHERCLEASTDSGIAAGPTPPP